MISERLPKPDYPGSTCHPGLDPRQVKYNGRRRRACWAGMEKKVVTEDSPKGADPAKAGQVVASGIVKFLVDPAKAGQVVVDETGEIVAVATILTMVKKLDQS